MTFPAPLRRHLPVACCALVLQAAAVGAEDLSSAFDRYATGKDTDMADVKARSAYDARGVVLTYEAYAALKDSPAAAAGRGAAADHIDAFKYAGIDGPRTGSHAFLPGLGQGEAGAGGDPPTHPFLGQDEMASIGGNIFGNPAVLGGFADVSRPVPVVHIVVTPSPPADYTVSINGRSYPATARSLYAVSGTIAIIVTRSGKQPCLWTGTPRPDQNQEVVCPL